MSIRSVVFFIISIFFLANYSFSQYKYKDINPFVVDSIRVSSGGVFGGTIWFSDSVNTKSDPAVIWLQNTAPNISVARLILSEDAGAGALLEYDGAANAFRISSGTGGPNSFVERFKVHRDLDAVIVGRGGFSTTSGVVQISMGGGSAEPASAVSSAVILYSVNVAGTNELKVMDGAGNKTLLSPHDPFTNKWIFYSEGGNGLVVRVDMQDFFKWFDDKFGTDFYKEWRVPVRLNVNSYRDSFVNKSISVSLSEIND